MNHGKSCRGLRGVGLLAAAVMVLLPVGMGVRAAVTLTGDQSFEQSLLLQGVSSDGKAGQPQTAKGLFMAGQYDEAMKMALKQAEEGDPEALFVLGLAHESGAGVAMSKEQAMEYYRKAAELNHQEALYRRVLLLLASGDNKQATEARDVLEKAAKNDAAVAGRFLGEAYFRGLFGGDPNAAKAIEWWKRSAEAGDVSSMMLLAEFHQRDMGDEHRQDLNLTAKYYGKAASIGHVPAMVALGSLLLNGDESIRNVARGKSWLLKAAASGEPMAHLVLGDYQENAKKDPVAALESYQAGASLGQVQCIMKVAEFYYDGKGVEKSSQKAVEYFRKAAQAGSPLAHFRLAGILLEGETPEVVASYAHLLEAAKGNLPAAQNELAMAYLTGRLGNADTVAAVAWLTRATKAGNPTAQHNLASIYEVGLGEIEVNLNNAKELYTLAAQQGHGAAAMALADLLSREIGGIRKDPAMAWAWASLVAESGDEKALELLKTVEERCTKEQRVKGRELLEKIKRRE